MIQAKQGGRKGTPICINLRHRFRIPEGESGWAEELGCTSLHGRTLACHPERSEGSVALGVEMLRCAQHDRAVLRPRHSHRRPFRLLSDGATALGVG